MCDAILPYTNGNVFVAGYAKSVSASILDRTSKEYGLTTTTVRIVVMRIRDHLFHERDV